jgi:cobalt-zinc-cadmium efflux system protein
VVAVFGSVGSVVELAEPTRFGSVAPIGDAFHTLFEMLAYAMAFGGSCTTEWIEDSESWSYGPSRLEPVPAAPNGYYWFQRSGSPRGRRLPEPAVLDPVPTLRIATGGFDVDLVTAFVLRVRG